MSCTIKNCTKSPASKGWCKPHYDAWYRTGDANSYIGDKSHLSLWEKVQQIGWTRNKDGCLEYNGYRNEHGYGQFRDASSNKLVRVHRLVYENLVEQIVGNNVILHLCDNPSCCEPSHLKQGSQTDNIKDMWNKDRAFKSDLKVCKNGHEYPAERPRAINKNRCRACANERNRRYYTRKALNAVASS